MHPVEKSWKTARILQKLVYISQTSPEVREMAIVSKARSFLSANPKYTEPIFHLLQTSTNRWLRNAHIRTILDKYIQYLINGYTSTSKHSITCRANKLGFGSVNNKILEDLRNLADKHNLTLQQLNEAITTLEGLQIK